MDSLNFRETSEVIDSRLLTSLVQKHNVEYVTKPLERRELWIQLTKEYNQCRGANASHARLAKRWHNMKQRARKRITFLKQKALSQSGKVAAKGIILNTAGFTTKELMKEIEEDDGNEYNGGDPEALEDGELGTTADMEVSESGGSGVSIVPAAAAAAAATNTSKTEKDNLLRDLLVCLVKKYGADDIKGGPSAKNRVWGDLAREYHRLSMGLLNANQKQLLTKWNNIRFHSKQRDNLLDSVNVEDTDLIVQKLLPYRQMVEDEAVERQLEAELQQDYLFASALHGHKMTLVRQDIAPSPPPAPVQHRKKKPSSSSAAAAAAAGQQSGAGGVASAALPPSQSASSSSSGRMVLVGAAGSSSSSSSSHHAKSMKNLEKQIFAEALRFEQERLQSQREIADLEKQKLIKDIELVDVMIESARADLARKGQLIQIM